MYGLCIDLICASRLQIKAIKKSDLFVASSINNWSFRFGRTLTVMHIREIKHHTRLIFFGNVKLHIYLSSITLLFILLYMTHNWVCPGSRPSLASLGCEIGFTAEYLRSSLLLGSWLVLLRCASHMSNIIYSWAISTRVRTNDLKHYCGVCTITRTRISRLTSDGS